MVHTAVIINKNARFLRSPAKRFSLSVRALKQFRTLENIKKAKNAVSRYIEFSPSLKHEEIRGCFKNAMQAASVNPP